MKKTIAFFPAHPSQVWLFHAVQPCLENLIDCRIIWILRDKDISCELSDLLGIDYQCVSKAATGLVGNAIELAGNIFKCLNIGYQQHIDLWVTKYGAGNIAGFLLQKKTLSFNDDDIDQVPIIAHTSYPFAESILCPDVTRMGKYEYKAKRYAGFHELFYLHPKRFKPDEGILTELGIDQSRRFVLIRLSALTAHHDKNIRGLSIEVVIRIIALCSRACVQCFISSEKELPSDLKKYLLKIPVNRVHHALFYASLFIGDSQTMTSEAAVLGTLALRCSDFKGRLSYIDELERYGLAYSFSPDQTAELLSSVEEFLLGNRNDEHKNLHTQFLEEKIDPVPWFAEQIASALKD